MLIWVIPPGGMLDAQPFGCVALLAPAAVVPIGTTTLSARHVVAAKPKARRVRLWRMNIGIPPEFKKRMNVAR